MGADGSSGRRLDETTNQPSNYRKRRYAYTKEDKCNGHLIKLDNLKLT